MTIVNEEINAKIERHGLWIQSNWEEGAIADLSNANLSFADLSNADLSFANLRNANLHNADLNCANLHNANLSFTDLSSANLSHANLDNANLSFTNLSFIDLNSAGLCYANLCYADLSSANLHDADLSCADLHYAIGNMREVKSMHFELVSVVWYYDPADEIIVFTDSVRKSLQEWKTIEPDEAAILLGDTQRWGHFIPLLWQLIEASPPIAWKGKPEAETGVPHDRYLSFN